MEHLKWTDGPYPAKAWSILQNMELNIGPEYIFDSIECIQTSRGPEYIVKSKMEMDRDNPEIRGKTVLIDRNVFIVKSVNRQLPNKPIQVGEPIGLLVESWSIGTKS